MTDETERKQMPEAPQGKSSRRSRPSPDTAFDLWLERGLHAMFDKVTQEPIPAELLELIEKHRRQNG